MAAVSHPAETRVFLDECFPPYVCWSRACLGKLMAFLVSNGIAKDAFAYRDPLAARWHSRRRAPCARGIRVARRLRRVRVLAVNLRLRETVL